jgi:hypothetical protein
VKAKCVYAKFIPDIADPECENCIFAVFRLYLRDVQLSSVIPAKAGIRCSQFGTFPKTDSCFCRNDRQLGKVAHRVIFMPYQIKSYENIADTNTFIAERAGKRFDYTV